MSARKAVFFAALCSLLYVTPLRGHGWGHYGHHDHGGCGDHCYDCVGCGSSGAAAQARPAQSPGRLDTSEGKVEEVVYLPGASAGAGMVELRVHTASGAVHARLAPAGFLRENHFALHEGDSVTVTGYWVEGPDGDLLVATLVKRQDRTLRLRSSEGRSLW